MKRLTTLSLLALLTLCSACAARPVLVENAKYQKVGSRSAKNVVESCINQAKYHGNYQAAAAREVGASRAASAATSAAGSALSGATSVGGVSVTGSAAPGVNKWLKNLMTDQSSDPAYKAAVERCLRNKGFKVASWN